MLYIGDQSFFIAGGGPPDAILRVGATWFLERTEGDINRHQQSTMENRIIDENFSVRGFMTSNQGVGNEGRDGDFGLFVPPLSKSAKLKNYRKKTILKLCLNH